MRLWIILPISRILFSFLILQATGGTTPEKRDMPDVTTAGVLGVLVNNMLSDYMKGCHLLLIRQGSSPAFDSILRSIKRMYIAGVVLELGITTPDLEGDLLKELRRGEDKFTCRVFIVDLTTATTIDETIAATNDTTATRMSSGFLRLLERMKLFLIPNTNMIFIGSESHVEKFLMDDALWNTINALYIAVPPQEVDEQKCSLSEDVKAFMRRDILSPMNQNVTKGHPRSVVTYSRCLYCNHGDKGIEIVDKWTPELGYTEGRKLLHGTEDDELKSKPVCDKGRIEKMHGYHSSYDNLIKSTTPELRKLFRSYETINKKIINVNWSITFNNFHNFMGHRFNIVTLDWFPIIDYKRDSDEMSSTVTPRDSVAVRMLTAIAETLNFTYEMRVPWDNQWGTSTENGNWTGIVGTLQHHKADFSMLTSWLRGRYQVVDFSRIYNSEPIVMVLSKPRPLPPYLALVRPLEASLWSAVFLSSVSAGFIFWILQRGWTAISGDRVLSLNRSVLFTWSILFEEPPKTMPTNMSGQMFVGWWWVYCTLITVVYKSSLIAHLSVPAMSKPIDSFEQLLEGDGWTWGYEPTYGSGWEWFKQNKNPIVMEIFEALEVQEITEQMNRLLRSQHAVITFKYRIKSLIASSYTDRFGYTPVYTAKAEYFNFGGYGWAFRKNAPFMNSIDLVKQRLIETGFIDLWLNDLIDTAAKKAREERSANKGHNDPDGANSNKIAVTTVKEESTGLVVLSVHHLQSVFFVLFLGFFGAFFAFMMEMLVKNCTKKSSTENYVCKP